MYFTSVKSSGWELLHPLSSHYRDSVAKQCHGVWWRSIIIRETSSVKRAAEYSPGRVGVMSKNNGSNALLAISVPARYLFTCLFCSVRSDLALMIFLLRLALSFLLFPTWFFHPAPSILLLPSCSFYPVFCHFCSVSYVLSFLHSF